MKKINLSSQLNIGFVCKSRFSLNKKLMNGSLQDKE